MNTRRTVLTFLLLALVWWLLSGYTDALLLSLGIFSCAVSVWIASRSEKQSLKFNIIKQITYLIWLLWEIIKSNVGVIRAIFNPRRISPQFFDVQCEGLNDQGKVVYANSITRTPGTVTIEVEAKSLRIHALLNEAKEDLETERMYQKVRGLF